MSRKRSHSPSTSRSTGSRHRPPSPSGTGRGVQPAPPPMRPPMAREEWNVYVYMRSHVMGRGRGGGLIADLDICFRIYDGTQDIYHDPNTNYHYDGNVRYTVRIPSMMYYWNEDNDNDRKWQHFAEFMTIQYRRQSGRHLVGIYQLNPQPGGLKSQRTGWGVTNPPDYITGADNPQVYGPLDRGFQPVTSIYPCYRNVPGGLQMILGLCFVPRVPPRIYIRTFGRFVINDHNNEYVRDIYERDFVQPDANDPNIVYHLLHPDLYNLTQHNVYATALYVCQGAKLVVSDFRFKNENNQYQVLRAGVTMNHIRSIYLPGSLVVIKGTFRMGFNATFVESVDGPHGPHREDFNLFIARHTLPAHAYDGTRMCISEHPFDNIERQYEPTLPIGGTVSSLHNMSKIIFLGAAESQYNSACWDLGIFQGNNQGHYALLNVTEGGRIVDIAPWTTGIALVNYRHHYERPFTTVLNPIDDSVLPFRVPSANDNHYFLRRLLGIIEAPERLAIGIPNGRWNSCIVSPNRGFVAMDDDYLSSDHNNGDQDLRRYVQGFVSHSCETILGLRHSDQYMDAQSAIDYRGLCETHGLKVPIPPEPLYPPIYSFENGKQHLKYTLDQNVKVVRDGNFTFNQNNPLTELKFKIGNEPQVYEWGFEDVEQRWWRKTTENVARYKRIWMEQDPQRGDFQEWHKVGIDYQHYLKMMVDEIDDVDEVNDLTPMMTKTLVLREVVPQIPQELPESRDDQ